MNGGRFSDFARAIRDLRLCRELSRIARSGLATIRSTAALHPGYLLFEAVIDVEFGRINPVC